MKLAAIQLWSGNACTECCRSGYQPNRTAHWITNRPQVFNVFNLPTCLEDLTNEELRAFDRQTLDIEQAGKALIGELSFDQVNWSPSASIWSIGQCLSHISVSARLYLTSIDRSITNGRRTGLRGGGPFVYSAFGRWLMRSIEPPPRFKIKTGRAYVPTPGRPVHEVLGEFIDVHEKVRERLRGSDGLDLVRCRMSHPSLPVLRFSLGVGFAIVTGHGRRHLWQAQQVRALLPGQQV